jgi:hypothetical protein
MPEPKVEKDYTLTKEVKTAVDKAIEAKEVPIYMERFEMEDEDKDRLKIEFEDEFAAIKAERDAIHLDEKFESLENQYNGKMQEDSRMQFNLNRNITKPIVNRVANFIKQGFFKSDPIYSISPRPEFDKEGGQEVSDKQQDFLDYKLDNLPFRAPGGKAILSAVKLGTGILKIPHVIKRMPRKREERYQGAPIQAGVDPRSNLPIIQNKGLDEFLSNWPKAREDYPGLVKQLEEGKEICIIAEYEETIYNDPLPQFIENKNFYVRLATEGYEGLADTKLIVERKNYTWWELEKEEAKDKFYDIDELVKDAKEPEKKRDKHEKETFDILECTYYFRAKKDDKQDTRIIFWYAEKEKVIIGSVLYPHDVMYYIPFYISEENPGFYQPGLAEFTTDSHIAQSVMLNLALGGVYMRNTVTPITDNQDVIDQFLEKRFSHGIPIEGKAQSVDFLQKYMQNIDVGGILNLMQFMKQGTEEEVGSSSLMSGNETPFDPNAPASKTMALLKMAGISVDEYIATMTPSFNQIAYVLLQIYYQMSTEGRKYAIRPDRVVGDNPFGEMSRNDMIARTNIQAQAYAYDFDKLEAKKEDFALWQIFRADPVVNSNPEAVYNMARVIVKGWSPKWNNNVNKVLPPLKQFRQQQMMVAMQAVALYVQAVVQESQATGIAPKFDVRKLIAMVAQAQKESVTPASPEELKAREEAASGPVQK